MSWGLCHGYFPTHSVTPAQAGAHPEMVRDSRKSRRISGWVPAFAGMTSSLGRCVAIIQLLGLQGRFSP